MKYLVAKVEGCYILCEQDPPKRGECYVAWRNGPPVLLIAGRIFNSKLIKPFVVATDVAYAYNMDECHRAGCCPSCQTGEFLKYK